MLVSGDVLIISAPAKMEAWVLQYPCLHKAVTATLEECGALRLIIQVPHPLPELGT